MRAVANLRDSPRIRSQNNLQLPCNSSKEEQYGGTQKGIQVTTELLKKVFAQSGLSIDNGNTAFNFIDEELLRNYEHFLQDPLRFRLKRKFKHIGP